MRLHLKGRTVESAMSACVVKIVWDDVVLLCFNTLYNEKTETYAAGSGSSRPLSRRRGSRTEIREAKKRFVCAEALGIIRELMVCHSALSS
jgi:hypothetical protein